MEWEKRKEQHEKKYYHMWRNQEGSNDERTNRNFISLLKHISSNLTPTLYYLLKLLGPSGTMLDGYGYGREYGHTTRQHYSLDRLPRTESEDKDHRCWLKALLLRSAD